MSRTEHPDPDKLLSSSAPPTGLSRSSQTVLVAGADDEKFQQLGTASVLVSEVTAEGGQIRLVPGPDGESAFRFPSFTQGGPYPRAVIRVVNAEAEDQLNPGSNDFTWGADFMLDAQNQGRAEDNGNNLVARGLYSEPTLYKAEIDGGRPSCTVKGSDGVLTVRAQPRVRPGVWYRLSCERRGQYLTVRAWRLDQNLTEPPISAVRVGLMGTVDMDSSLIPMEIGGKLAPDGSMILTATDQFNGTVANPFLDIED